MLMDFRDWLKGWMAYAIVGLISIPFVLWGIGEYIRGGSDEPIATVNGQDISPRTFDAAYNQERQRLAQAFGGTIPPAMLEGMDLKRQVLDALILRELLLQYAQEHRLRVSDAEVAALIRGIPAFQQDGVFSQERYEQVVALQGLSTLGFEDEVRHDLVLEQLQRAISETAFVASGEVDQYIRLRDQVRKVEVYLLPAEPRRAEIKPDEARLRAYFEEHKQDFRRPERVKLDMVELSVADLAQRMQPSEQDIQRAYEDYLAQVRQDEGREARHILLKIPAGGHDEEVHKQAEALRARIEQGEDFAKLAREYSQDKASAADGGKLGLIKRGMMVEPFEKVLFSLKEGEVSAPVKTPFGWHIIRVDRIERVQAKSLDEVRDQITADARRQLAEDQFHELADRLATLAYEMPDSLAPVAEQLGLKVTRSDWITRDHGQGLAANSKLRNVAFSPEVLEQGRNSELIDLGDDRVVVIRVAEHQPAAERPYEEVRAEVERRVIEQELAKVMTTDAESLAARLATPGEPGDIDALGARRDFSGEIHRTGQQDVDPAILRAAFSVGRPSAKPLTDSVRLANGDMAVVRVISVQDGDPAKVSKEERERLRNELRQASGASELASFIAYLRDRAKITQRQEL